MSVTLIHTSDWQLGKQFANVPGDAGAALRDQRIETVRAVAKVAHERRADAVVVSGDVFETNAVADRTLRQTLDALESFAGDWVFIPGNHDPALADSVWSRAGHVCAGQGGTPGNVHFLVKPEQPLLLKDGALAILPAVLERRHEVDDPTAWFDRAQTPEGAVRVGLAHGSVKERLPAASEAPNPIAADRAGTAGLDYLALGDWHGTLRIDDRTWYAGTPEADRFGSSDPGNVLAVGIDRPGAPPSVERIPVGRYVWRQSERAIHGVPDVDALERHLESLCPDPARLLVWLKLAGVVDFALHEKLRDRLAAWDARLRHLRCEDEALVAHPSDDDLDGIDRGGFVRAAVETLRARAEDPHDAEREIARAALLRLYHEHVRMGSASC